ncbi:HAD hydrolase-like protein [Amycolatopsis sp. DSM 110486]|nr:HAD hydrolase-like protein [Amycolatopsis sp. DSM 110486]
MRWKQCGDSVARIKLEVFGLAQYLDLEASAFGDDNAERPKFVTIAQQRAEQRTGTRFANADTVLVGDTPNDVKAGLAAEVNVIAVATGKSTPDELRTAGAAHVIHNLSEFPSL